MTGTFTRNHDFTPETDIVSSEVDAEFNTIFAALNSILSENDKVDLIEDDAVDTQHIADDAVEAAQLADAALLGLSESGVVRRGKSIIATEESTSSSSFTTLATPDRVENVVLPSGGLIVVGYYAEWKESSAGQGQAAIFLGSNQLKVPNLSGSLETQCGRGPSQSNFSPLVTFPVGLVSGDSSAGSISAATTGQALAAVKHSGTSLGSLVAGFDIYAVNMAIPLGGLCPIFADAGTYTVSVQFRALSGTVTARTRKLWLWTIDF
ncbi:MAG: hypothetical protein C4558_02450 [Dehalococcoidia bacterium]|nr:MAG: hypothetical protein C4558_02450 [Dehalococcoidia bacterium]